MALGAYSRFSKDSHHPKKLATWDNKVKEDSLGKQRGKDQGLWWSWACVPVMPFEQHCTLARSLSLWCSVLSSIIYRVVTRTKWDKKCIRKYWAWYLLATWLHTMCCTAMKHEQEMDQKHQRKYNEDNCCYYFPWNWFLVYLSKSKNPETILFLYYRVSTTEPYFY